MKHAALLALGFALAACSQGVPAGDATPEARAPDEVGRSAAPAAGAAKDEGAVVEESNELFEFGYRLPPAVTRIPKLRGMLEADRDASLAALRQDATEWREEAALEGIPFRPYSATTVWKVVADLPSVLSLSSTVSTYMGGAHGNSSFGALLWDKEADRRRKPVDLFDADRLRAAVQPAFCDAIDAARAERRRAPVKRSAEMFEDCIDPLAQTLILGSSNRRTFDRIGVLVAPYAAGPYAEGSYEVTLPVTPAVLAAVKPDDRALFSEGR